MARNVGDSSLFTRRTLWSCLLLLCLADSSLCPAQLPNLRRPAPAEEDEKDSTHGLNTERRVNQQLEQLSAAGKKKDAAAVREIVESLRDADPMLIVPGPRGSFIPLHRDLVQRLQLLDSETLSSIETSAGAMNEQLNDSLNAGPQAIVELLHRSAGTTTGWQAHLILAAIHHDRGNSLAAQYWLRPLLNSAVPEEIRLAATRLDNQLQAAQGIVTGRDESTEATQDEASNNSDGDSSTNDAEKSDATNDGPTKVQQNEDPSKEEKQGEEKGADEATASTPSDDFSAKKSGPELFVHWMQRVPLGDSERRASQEMVQRAGSNQIIPWTAWEPLIDDSMVFVRTPYLIKAFDRASGQHLWTKVIQRRAARLEEMAVPAGPMFPQDDDKVNSVLNSPDFVTVHRNEIIGRLTADDERVYAVCQMVDGTMFRNADEMRMRFMVDQNASFSAGVWELVALEKSSGRRVWTAGGAPIEEQFGNELSGSWFAGPPFVHGAELLTVTERAGQVQLVSLAAQTGQVEWTVPLISPDNEISRDLQRQLQHSQIQASSGIVVVSAGGFLFAIDELSRSILWIVKLPVEAVANARAEIPFPRGTPMVRALQPFGKVWRSEAPFIVGSSLILSSSECAQLLVLEMLTGRLIARNSLGQSRLILYHDETNLIVASDQNIRNVKVPSFTSQWAQTYDRQLAVPVGRAARYNDQLLIPMSDGSIQVRDFNSGAYIRSLSGFRPPRSAGGLYGAGDHPFASISLPKQASEGDGTTSKSDGHTSPSMLSYSPDFVAMLSLEPEVLQPDQDPFQKVSFLVETGQYELAADTIKTVPVHALNAEPIRRLQFRIAMGLLTNRFESSARDDSGTLKQLLEIAKTPDELALAELLQLKNLVDRQSPEVFAELVRLLSLDESILNVTVVPLERLEECVRNSSVSPIDRSSMETGEESLRMPFRSLIMAHLRKQLDDKISDAVQSRVAGLKSLSDEDLLQLHHPSLLPECLVRVDEHLKTGELRESTVHLILAAVSLNSGSSPARAETSTRIAELLKKAREIADHDVIREPSVAVMVRRLIHVLSSELMESTESTLPADEVAKAVEGQWKQLPDSEYSLVPVQTAGVQAYRQVNVRSVATAASHDPFLSAFHWSVRREPGALLARSLLSPETSLWNLKLSAQENAVVFSDEEIYRIGSVILLQNSSGVSAFSVVDHRWLWTRAVASQSSRRRFMMDRMTFPNLRLSLHYPFGNPIGAFSYRWVCMQSGSKVEVLDLLTGRTLWTMTHDKDVSFRVIGCEGLLGLSSGIVHAGDELELLNPLDGSALQADVDRDAIAEGFITATAEALVLTGTGAGGRRQKNLQWIRPISREVIHSLDAEDMESCTFIDANTLAIVSGDETCQVVNLQTGATRSLSFDSTNEEIAEIDPAEIRIFCDALNYYVTELDDDGAFRVLGMSMTENLEPVGNQLRAVNRVSGKVSWDARFSKPTFAGFHSESGPFLLIMNDESPDAKMNRMVMPGLGGTAQKWSIRGFSRLDGKAKLNFTTQIRAVNGYVSLKQLENGVQDLEAFGNRVRFVPTKSTVP